MSKVLYPKKHAPASGAHSSPVGSRDAYVVVFSDLSGQLPDEVKGYETETQAKMAAYYHCRLIGFRDAAVLYTRQEWDEMMSNG